MRIIDSFKLPDLLELAVQPAQVASFERNYQSWADAAVRGHTFSFKNDGRVLGVGGVLPQWRGRGVAWAVIGCDTDRTDWLWATRSLIEYLDGIQTDPNYRRLETTVRNDFPQGHRWARLLGFEQEGVMRKYADDGGDHAMYARIR